MLVKLHDQNLGFLCGGIMSEETVVKKLQELVGDLTHAEREELRLLFELGHGFSIIRNYRITLVIA